MRVFTGYERPGVAPDVQWGVVVQGLKMAAKEAAKGGRAVLRPPSNLT